MYQMEWGANKVNLENNTVFQFRIRPTIQFIWFIVLVVIIIIIMLQKCIMISSLGVNNDIGIVGVDKLLAPKIDYNNGYNNNNVIFGCRRPMR